MRLYTILYWSYGRPWITLAHYNQESVILSVTWLVSQISVELVATSKFQVSTTFLAGDIAFLVSLL